MQDIEQAIAVVTQTAGEVGMTRDQLARAKDLLQRYGDERQRLQEQLVELIGGTDTDGVSSRWKDLCEKGAGLLDSVDGAVPASPSGEGLAGVGLNDFYQGEKKVWAAAAQGQVALVAEVISKVRAANLELTDECNQELASIREGGAEAEKAIAENCEEIKSGLTEFSQNVASRLNDKSITTWMKDGTAREFAKQWNQTHSQNSQEIVKAAQDKTALKKQLSDRIQVLETAREQLDEPWIDEMFRTGEDGAKSLADSGETGDYRAADWARFGESSLEPLRERRDAAKEQAKAVFSETLPAYAELLKTSFVALTDDPSTVETWRSDLDDLTGRIDESLASVQALVDDLADGPFKQAAGESVADVKDLYTSGMKALQDGIRDAEEPLRG